MPYLIAEIGINHNGDLDTALELIKDAKQVGFNCVKFQKRNPDVCVPEEQKNTLRKWCGKEMTYLEYKKCIEFGKSEYDVISAYCKHLGIDWTASVWDLDSLEFMMQYPEVPFIKIPSALVDNEELIEAVNKTGKDVIISDGMITTSELWNAAHKYDNLIGILHTNSTYPCNEKELDLNIIKYYHNTLGKYLYYHKTNPSIGYSGHERGYEATIVAVAVGAEIIERHVTLDNDMQGTDHKASLNIQDCAQMIYRISYICKMLGNDIKEDLYSGENEVAARLKI